MLENILQFRDDLVAEYKRVQLATSASCALTCTASQLPRALPVADIRQLHQQQSQPVKNRVTKHLNNVTISSEMQQNIQQALRKSRKKNAAPGTVNELVEETIEDERQR